MDLSGLASKFAMAAAEVDYAAQHGVEKAARLIQDTAQSAIGTYTFGWPELAESTQEERARQGFTPNDPLLRTGALKDSIQRVSAHHEAWVGTNDSKAFWMEHGTIKAPPRPFMSSALVASRDKIKGVFGETMRKSFTASRDHQDD